ncbi:MAG: hypothetical protein AAFQ94_00025 [Bacteroidota bacterium]
MRLPWISVFILLALSMNAHAQKEEALPYEEIPSYPSDYTSGNVIARMIDGLGYRFYWASEGLTASDIAYRPSEDASNVQETMVHIYDLSVMILNAATGTPNKRSEKTEFNDHQEIRIATLHNLKKASDLFLNMDAKAVEGLNITFAVGDRSTEIPFWHVLNGPLADAIYHTGQIVSFRRSAGNPINPKVNVLTGKNGS